MKAYDDFSSTHNTQCSLNDHYGMPKFDAMYMGGGGGTQIRSYVRLKSFSGFLWLLIWLYELCVIFSLTFWPRGAMWLSIIVVYGTKFKPLVIVKLIPLSHLLAISRRPLCALDLDNFHQSAVKSPQNVKSMTPGSFIVDHSTLLARSHRDYMRSQCDSSTLSTRSYWAFCALSAPKSFSLRFHYGFNAFATRSLCLHYVYSATSSVYFLILAGVCTPSKINCSHTYLRSWWRSHCVFRKYKARGKAKQGL